MKVKGFLRIILILLLLSINIGCDQVSKSIVRKKLHYYDQVTFLNNHFTIIKVENTGAFLSLGNTLSGPLKMILLNLLPLLAVAAGLVFMLTRELTRTTLFSIILIVGGGFGNIYDRIRYGSVTDFMHINFGFFQTGIFNVADVSIMLGMIILLLHAIFKKKDKVKEQPEQI
ncbi:signal peptidase II [Mucilaginibacter sp. OK098]|uniref:signal peptidase II n=1 Tax=Mucilaginibacter sp. OK098 TaxID=1855297 RepID=UPI0009101E57|nr:signal peptidase II [Mucilaginibacter sp. OK098]SHN10172.1 signal peptidase II [Mucilaginibacter sp. OK098]